MSLWRMVTSSAVALAAFHISIAIGAPTLVLVPYASMQENREVQPVYATLHDPAIAKGKIRAVLEENPHNRPARVMLGRLLLQEGSINASKEAVEPLLAGTPAYPPALDLLLELAQASGNKKMASSAYARMLAARPEDLDVLAGKAESEGDIDRSEQIRKRAITASHPKTRVYKEYELGRFYLRQGQFSKAVGVLKSALPEIENLGAGWVSRVHSDCALAFWANGNREEALRESLVAAEAVANCPTDDPELLATSVMMAHMLAEAGVGTVDDQAKARDLLSRSVKTMPATKPHSLGAVVLAVGGGGSMKDLAARVRAVLETAPNLEWALWAALYVGRSEPEHAKDLLELLPEKSLQRRIADIEQKAQARPATQKGT